MKQNSFTKALVAVCIIALPATPLIAQCTSFVKKKCMPKIQPFTQNGQVNTTTLTAGQKTSLNLTFYSGQDYRILVCAQEQLGDVSFVVKDMQKKVVFDSKKNDLPDFWDFKVKNTQQFTIEVQIPDSESTSSVLPSGCVSIMVGFKKG
ncbi:MAG TPA: hypothetical protein VGC65_04965 [Bacteroidia bacterium]|jgi:hypothetical protein